MNGREFFHGVSVIVGDFHFAGMGLFPSEANAPLVVDSNTVLCGSFGSECFQPIAGRREQILQCIRLVQVDEFASRRFLYVQRQLWRHLAPVHFFGVRICETS